MMHHDCATLNYSHAYSYTLNQFTVLSTVIFSIHFCWCTNTSVDQNRNTVAKPKYHYGTWPMFCCWLTERGGSLWMDKIQSTWHQLTQDPIDCEFGCRVFNQKGRSFMRAARACA